MHASPQFLFQGPLLGLLPLAHRLSQDREVPLPGPSANVREAQEVERFRLAFATLAPILFRKAAKFDDSRLVGSLHTFWRRDLNIMLDNEYLRCQNRRPLPTRRNS